MGVGLQPLLILSLSPACAGQLAHLVSDYLQRRGPFSRQARAGFQCSIKAQVGLLRQYCGFTSNTDVISLASLDRVSMCWTGGSLTLPDSAGSAHAFFLPERGVVAPSLQFSASCAAAWAFLWATSLHAVGNSVDWPSPSAHAFRLAGHCAQAVTLI